MSKGRQLGRWTESDRDVPSALRDWLAGLRADGPSDDQLRDLAARVRATLNAEQNDVAEASSVPKAGASSFKRIARVAGTSVAIGVAVALGGAFYRTLPQPSSGGVPSEEERLAPVVIAAAVPSAEPPRPSAPALQHAPSAEPGPTMRASRPQPAPARLKSGGVQPPLSDPEAELELLRRARVQLASTPQRALDTTDQHHAQFRHGVFAQEREAIAIEALVRLGKNAQAQQRARAFHSHYPNSAYTRRLQTMAPLP